MEKYLLRQKKTSLSVECSNSDSDTSESSDSEQSLNLNISLEIDSSQHDERDENVEPVKKKRKVLNANWLCDSRLKPWLVETETGLPRCKVCCVNLQTKGGKIDLIKHGSTKKHLRFSNAIQLHTGSEEMIIGDAKKTSFAEIRLAAFCAEHNVAFSTMDHLVPLIRQSFEDSKVAKHLKCGRTKTTALVRNVLGKSQLDFVIQKMRHNHFSLCADESTDCSTTKILSLVVRIECDGKICDFFLACLDVIKADSDSIYTEITKFLTFNEVDYKKYLIGFGADGASVMTGPNKSVAAFLKKDCPHMFIFKCTCHSLALCASKACAELPMFVESSIRDIYNFIQTSPKRIVLFKQLQDVFDLKPHKILHPSQTRWLSLESAVLRILEKLDILKLYFIHEDLEKFDSVNRINQTLSDPLFEMYLNFLKFILHDINCLNKLFQSESPQIHLLNEELHCLFLKIFDYFAFTERVNIDDLKFINIDADYIKPIDETYFGADVEFLIENNTASILEFKQNCLKFYVTLCNEILKRFDLQSDLLKCVEILAPKNVIQKKNFSLAKLIKHFPTLEIESLQTVDSDWRALRQLDFHKHGLTCETHLEVFWTTVLNIRKNDNSLCFPNLKKIIWSVLTLPVSSANVERIFSQINLNKTKTRNRLQTNTLSGILYTKDYLKKNRQECHDINFSEDRNVLKHFKSTIYGKKGPKSKT